MAPTVGQANAIPMYTSMTEPSLGGTDGLKKSISTAEATRATQSTHMDQASNAAARWLIPPTARPRSFLPVLSQPHSTARPSAKRYDNRYEGEDPVRTSENTYSTHSGE